MMRVELPPPRDLTLDDVTVLGAADRARRYELDNGVLVIMPPPDGEHNEVMMRLAVWFIEHGYPVERVLPNLGLPIAWPTAGRCPDLMVLRRKPEPRTVRVDRPT